MSSSRLWHNANYQRIKNSIFALLGDECVHCGFKDRRALQVDHINGGGSKERKSKGGTYGFQFMVKQITSGRKDYQILCANCNWIKRTVKNENRK